MCSGKHSVTWVWDRAEDDDCCLLRASGAVYVVEYSIDIGEDGCSGAVGFDSLARAVSFLGWVLSHYFEQHGATAVSSCIQGVDEYMEEERRG